MIDPTGRQIPSTHAALPADYSPQAFSRRLVSGILTLFILSVVIAAATALIPAIVPGFDDLLCPYAGDCR